MCALATPGNSPKPTLASWLTQVIFTREAHACVQWLPVNTEIAVAGGVDFFGYPKTLNRVEMTWDSRRARAEVFEENQRDALLVVETGRTGIPLPKFDLAAVTYPLLLGRRLEATMRFRGGRVKLNPWAAEAAIKMSPVLLERLGLAQSPDRVLMSFELTGASALLPAPIGGDCMGSKNRGDWGHWRFDRRLLSAAPRRDSL